MSVTRRIFVSMPADRWLSTNQNDLKWAIVDRIIGLGYVPEIFTNPRGDASLVANKAWSANDADDVLRRCVGAVLIGLPRWDFGAAKLPSEFCHYEGAMARTLGLPLLILRQNDVLDRVVFNDGFGPYIGKFDSTASSAWLQSKEFNTAFDYWRADLEKRRDVFLGYCGSLSNTAQKVKRLLTEELGITVLDWNEFTTARTIMDEIHKAAVRCSGAIFLFTEDDTLDKPAPSGKAVPRDNVVFEAGYFASLKGKDHVLIIREPGAKMPADLGGDIYVTLKSRTAIVNIKSEVRKFVDAL